MITSRLVPETNHPKTGILHFLPKKESISHLRWNTHKMIITFNGFINLLIQLFGNKLNN